MKFRLNTCAGALVISLLDRGSSYFFLVLALLFQVLQVPYVCLFTMSFPAMLLLCEELVPGKRFSTLSGKMDIFF